MSESLEKKVSKFDKRVIYQCLIFGATILGSVIGIQTFDYYRKLTQYEERINIKEAHKDARDVLDEYSPLVLRILHYPEVKAAEDYLEETNNLNHK